MAVWKQLLVVAVLALLGYAGYEGYRHQSAAPDAAASRDQGRGSRSIPVETARAEIRAIRQTVEAVGTTRARQSVEIVPEAEGRVIELAISPGETVAQGAVLVRLDDAIARADLAEAEARLKERTQALERIRQLLRTNAAAAATLEEAEARKAEARAQVDRAARRLQERTIVAPFAGVVGLSNVDIGARVDQGTLITRLDDLDEIEIEFALPETLFAQVHEGQPVAASSAAFPGQRFEGRIEAKDNRIDPVSRAFRTRAILPNPEGTLPAGMFLSLTLTLSETDRVVIPEEALVFQAAETYVFAVRDGTAHRVPVRTGQRRDGMVAVLEGLEAGALVAVRGLQTLRDGSTVDVIAGPGGDDTGGNADDESARAAPDGDNT